MIGLKCYLLSPKKLFFLFIFVFVLILRSFSQHCVPYFPLKRYAKIEYQHFDANNRLILSESLKVIQKEEDSSGEFVKVERESFNSKGTSLGTNYFLSGCQNGAFFIQMKSRLDMKALNSFKNSFKNMNINLSEDKIIFPDTFYPGERLNDATLKIKISSKTITSLRLSIKVYNRKVIGFDKIEVSSGTYKCVKITSDIQMMVPVSIILHTVEWYAPNIGLVKSNVYTQKNTLSETIMLTGLK